MGLRDKIPLIRSERRVVRYFGYVLYFFVFLTIVSALDGSDSVDIEDREYVNITHDEFQDMFGRYGCNLTDYQKAEKFKEFEGKYVRWTGEVHRVSDDGRRVRLDMSEHDKGEWYGGHVLVELRSDQKQKLLTISENDKIKVDGRLETYKYFSDFDSDEVFRLADGVILE